MSAKIEDAYEAAQLLSLGGVIYAAAGWTRAELIAELGRIANRMDESNEREAVAKVVILRFVSSGLGTMSLAKRLVGVLLPLRR